MASSLKGILKNPQQARDAGLLPKLKPPSRYPGANNIHPFRRPPTANPGNLAKPPIPGAGTGAPPAVPTGSVPTPVAPPVPPPPGAPPPPGPILAPPLVAPLAKPPAPGEDVQVPPSQTPDFDFPRVHPPDYPPIKQPSEDNPIGTPGKWYKGFYTFMRVSTCPFCPLIGLPYWQVDKGFGEFDFLAPLTGLTIDRDRDTQFYQGGRAIVFSDARGPGQVAGAGIGRGYWWQDAGLTGAVPYDYEPATPGLNRPRPYNSAPPAPAIPLAPPNPYTEPPGWPQTEPDDPDTDPDEPPTPERMPGGKPLPDTPIPPDIEIPDFPPPLPQHPEVDPSNPDPEPLYPPKPGEWPTGPKEPAIAPEPPEETPGIPEQPPEQEPPERSQPDSPGTAPGVPFPVLPPLVPEQEPETPDEPEPDSPPVEVPQPSPDEFPPEVPQPEFPPLSEPTPENVPEQNPGPYPGPEEPLPEAPPLVDPQPGEAPAPVPTPGPLPVPSFPPNPIPEPVPEPTTEPETEPSAPPIPSPQPVPQPQPDPQPDPSEPPTDPDMPPPPLLPPNTVPTPTNPTPDPPPGNPCPPGCSTEGDCMSCCSAADCAEIINRLKDIDNAIVGATAIYINQTDCSGEVTELKLEGPRIAVMARAIEELNKANDARAKRACDTIAAVPEWWQVRIGADRPQMVIQFGEVMEDDKIGPAKWPITIPHYHWSEGTVPAIPSYTKGSWEGILTLKDNSKLIVNAISQSEAFAVISSLEIHIDPSMLQDSFIKVGERRGQPLQEIQVTPVVGKFFATGQKDLEPSWTVSFRD